MYRFSYLCSMPEFLKDHPLRELNSFHFDVRANKYCECKSINDIREVLSSPGLSGEPVLVLGEGSNILFSGDFKGLIIRPLILGREIVREDRDFVWIKAGAGENWDDFVAWTTAWGYGGIENLSLIPGSVGSAPIQNIGAYGVELEQFIQEVSAIDVQTGQKLTFEKESCRFGYRDSIFKQEWKGKCIISSITLRLSKKPELNLSYHMVAEKMANTGKNDIETLRQVIIEIRRSKLPDPDETGNAGSFFKNPVVAAEKYEKLLAENPELPSYPAPGGTRKLPAAWLIDHCGWKGKRLGDAGTWPNQPLVLVNYGKATGKEILDLASRIEDNVEEKFSIRLEKEVNVV